MAEHGSNVTQIKKREGQTESEGVKWVEAVSACPEVVSAC